MKMHSASVIVLVGLMGSTIVYAQQDYNAGLKQELNQEMDQLYPKKGKRLAKNQVVQVQEVAADDVRPASSTPTTVNVTTAPAAQAPVVAQPQPIYIMQAPPAAQQQPTTTVEANVGNQARIEQLHKQREEIERQTEEKLIQKLEDDRLLSEKDRADRLFNPAAGSAATQPGGLNNNPVPNAGPAAYNGVNQQPAIGTPATGAVVTPVQSVTPAAAMATTTSDAAAIDAAVAQEEEKTAFTIGGKLGIASYPTVSNVNGVYATGFELGLLLPGGLGVETTFLMSSYDIKNVVVRPNQSLMTRMDQINVTGGLNYRVLPGRVRPIVGILAGYTRRSFDDTVFFSGYNAQNTVSHAIDAGLSAGVDIQAAKKLLVGADIRYMMNLSSRTDNPFAYNDSIGKPIDQLSYYIATLNLKLEL